MNLFPAVDPIPLPAPVALFKGLHVLTLALHFTAVQLLLGGLAVATWLNFLGHRRQGDAAFAPINASAVLARRLPVVMTYVINLGVPPLLFAQVLYGRCLYTSSILIGIYWIAVIFLLMGCYWHLYRFAAAAEAGKAGWRLGLAALVMAGAIARIYSTNMTLMLRPEVWQQMYSTTALGTRLPPSDDPTLLPRWLFMLNGGLVMAGLWMIWQAGRSNIHGPLKFYLLRHGGWLACIMAATQGAMAYWVLQAQPSAVFHELMAQSLYLAAGWTWGGAMALICLLGLWVALDKTPSATPGWLGLGLGLVALLGLTVYRDGIRDLTLASKGFDVWQRQVVANGTMVALFLVLLVVALGIMAWLIAVMVRAKPISEKVV